MDVLTRLRAGANPAATLLRVVAGLLLAWHGYRKFADGLEGFEGFLQFLELPAPGLLAVVVAVLELVGGLMLAAGLMTRLVSLLFVVQFALLVFWIKLGKMDAVLLAGGESPAIELDLLFGSIAAYFAAAGPGPLSVDAVMGLERSVETDERVAVTV